MTKRISHSLFVALILTFFVLSGCTSDDTDTSDQHTPTSTLEIESNTSESSDPNAQEKQALQSLIFTSQYDSPEYYQRVSQAVSNIQAQITTEQARSEGNIEICEEIADQDQQNQCLNSVRFQQAVQERNPQVCEAIINQNQAKNCTQQVIFSQAVDNQEESECEQITEAPLKESCQNNIRFIKATQQLDNSFCTQITDENQRTMCTDQVQQRQALEANS